ncbi:hypothetical protein EBBID32_6840 [Sphingobium indicum BiD32]|uniref:Uncharacterized protein n=1 Tax=Sphingobium indicum BiD32 TaxID=1301087 RepID=N1MLL5_9SPHN|nr:hypothetical protein [Sphingobium indicum]CCW16348.1 hypothetical protein EBBID32_6840 [Sphingobium indicum BiD32]
MSAEIEHSPEQSIDADPEQERAAVCPPAMTWWAIGFLPLLCLGARRPAPSFAKVRSATDTEEGQ